MRGVVIGVALVTGTLAATPAWAGVYHHREMNTTPPTELNDVLAQRNDLRSIDERPGGASSLRDEYRNEVAKLEPREADGTLKPAERLDLSACYIRLGRFDKAIALLEPKRKEDEPTRFLLLSNLAAACWGAGKEFWPRAAQYQRESLDAWPAHYPGWSWEEWHRYLRAEDLLLKLMEARQRGDDKLALDPLFLGVTFTRRDGKYEVGGLEASQAKRLPADAEALVIQLILWLPLDDQLYWYYGELLNARRQVAEAFRVMDRLVDAAGMSNVKPLRDHRRALKQALDEDPSLSRPQFRFVGEAEPPVTGALPSWQQVGAGFLLGALVAVAVLLQVQEWRRRAAARARARVSPAKPPAPAGARLPPPDERISRPGG